MERILVSIIRTYKNTISPLLGNLFGRACRFTPTCSEYMVDAIKKKGISVGLVLGVLRFIRCNPLSKPGYDPVH